MLAGAETQMISLWSVDDAATRDLMSEYYRLLKSDVGRSEALRRVLLSFLSAPKSKPKPKQKVFNRQHPYYWASFIQSGEWANLAGKR